MIMNFKIWNGKESINGISADEIKKSFGNKTLALFYNIENVIERIEDIDILRSVYNLTLEEYPTNEDVCNGYLQALAKQEEEAKEQANQLDRIEANTASLKADIEQSAIDSYTLELMESGVLQDMAYRTLVESLKRLYSKGLVTKEMLDIRLANGVITEAEYEYIIGQLLFSKLRNYALNSNKNNHH